MIVLLEIFSVVFIVSTLLGFLNPCLYTNVEKMCVAESINGEKNILIFSHKVGYIIDSNNGFDFDSAYKIYYIYGGKSYCYVVNTQVNTEMNEKVEFISNPFDIWNNLVTVKMKYYINKGI